jgi:hypothetical protein
MAKKILKEGQWTVAIDTSSQGPFRLSVDGKYPSTSYQHKIYFPDDARRFFIEGSFNEDSIKFPHAQRNQEDERKKRQFGSKNKGTTGRCVRQLDHFVQTQKCKGEISNGTPIKASGVPGEFITIKLIDK